MLEEIETNLKPCAFCGSKPKFTRFPKEVSKNRLHYALGVKCEVCLGFVLPKDSVTLVLENESPTDQDLLRQARVLVFNKWNERK